MSSSRARPAEDLQEEALSDQLAFLERIQHTTGRPAPVPHLAVPDSGAPVWTALERHLLSRPGPAQACDGERSESAKSEERLAPLVLIAGTEMRFVALSGSPQEDKCQFYELKRHRADSGEVKLGSAE